LLVLVEDSCSAARHLLADGVHAAGRLPVNEVQGGLIAALVSTVTVMSVDGDQDSEPEPDRQGAPASKCQRGDSPHMHTALGRERIAVPMSASAVDVSVGRDAHDPDEHIVAASWGRRGSGWPPPRRSGDTPALTGLSRRGPPPEAGPRLA